MRTRPAVPPPPAFYQTIYTTGYGAGAGTPAAIPVQGIPVVNLDDDDDDVLPQGEVPQPQGEPEPEFPGGDDPSDSDQNGPSDARESDMPDQSSHQDEGESPDHADTDPYGDPTDTQADVTVTPATARGY